ncbi:hypothetical protein C8J57DRAFT_1506075 [Mycena rebaudengoi]|nr:hypothetical protein C8J57DRAFT_1506075 [Mycena rebaudengoi]
MPCSSLANAITPASFLQHLSQHPNFLALLEHRVDFFPPSSPQGVFTTDHEVVNGACNDCQPTMARGAFRTRIMGQVAEVSLTSDGHQMVVVQVPDWSSSGWASDTFHDFWARQIGVLFATETDLRVRELLKHEEVTIRTWTDGIRIKIHVMPPTLFIAPGEGGAFRTSTCADQNESLLVAHRTYIFDSTLHLTADTVELKTLRVNAVEIQEVKPSAHGPV